MKQCQLADVAPIHGTAAVTNQRLHWFAQVRRNREEQLIKQMIAQVRGGKATHESLLSLATAISELRLIESGLDRQVKEQAHSENANG